MSASRIHTLAGMRDVVGRDYGTLRAAAGGFATVADGSGYRAIDTPLLESAELFARKAGGELASQAYTFIDRGGRRISVRPEFTSSVIRHFVGLDPRPTLPVRLQYGGPVFRYEQGGNGPFRQFTQVGAELIGAGGVDGDSEVLTLVLEGLQATGVAGLQMRVGHIGLLQDLLNGYGLSDTANLFAVGSVQALKSGQSDVEGLMRQALEMGLVKKGPGPLAGDGPGETEVEGSRDLIQRVLTGAMAGPAGRRTPDQIFRRLLRKVQHADDAGRLRAALELIGELAGVDGSPTQALDRAREVGTRHGVKPGWLDDLGALVDAVTARIGDGADLKLDFGLTMGIAYYTGIIFEVAGPDGVSLGSGGRYDGLVRALGGDDVPAMGFAITLERVAAALEGPRTSTTASGV